MATTFSRTFSILKVDPCREGTELQSMKTIDSITCLIVPQDPEHQAEEDNKGSREDEQIPEAEGSKDPDEEEDEANCIQEKGAEEKQQAAAHTAGIIHDRRG
ncbi:hypothetical protein EYF80_008074 [Liparis tanakae]|uniref:Uncharacterized protein n=1 Tax=Liparis tanakae TaxID=230148 RepID=A0A4Z2IVU1_9TELE|nr:hypothetical protein EYF80_008074 [Liparis tanakae]